YLQAKKNSAASSPGGKMTKQVMQVSTYYNSNGSFNHFDPDTNDYAYYMHPSLGVYKKLNVSNSTLLRIAGTSYGESWNIAGAILAIPFVVFHKYREQIRQGYSCFRNVTWKIDNTLCDMRNANAATDQAYYDDNPGFKAFMDAVPSTRIPNMVSAVFATIRACLYDTHNFVDSSVPIYPGDIDFSHGGLGWDGNDFHLSSRKAYKTRYKAGFKWNSSDGVHSDDIWGMTNYENPAIYKLVHTRNPKTKLADMKAIFNPPSGTAQKFWYESAGGFLSGGNGTIIYKAEANFEVLYNNGKIIGSGNATHGRNAHGGLASSYNNYIEPGTIK
ncbi:MAG: hypothetical protein ACTHL3_07620, partial [Candidatus Nitrosocosmicus sp.]